MNEIEWLTLTEPLAMLDYIGDRASNRTLTLFVVAMWRRESNIPDQSSLHALCNVLEHRADGNGTAEADIAALRARWPVDFSLGEGMSLNRYVRQACSWFVEKLTPNSAKVIEEAALANLLREIFGNPFSQQLQNCRYCCGGIVPTDREENDCGVCGGDGKSRDLARWLAWNNGTIPHLAQSIYDNRDWQAMLILCDALEEVGCQDAAIIDHLRGQEPCPWCYAFGITEIGQLIELPRPHRLATKCNRCNGTGKRSATHTRGCWCLDILLEKT